MRIITITKDEQMLDNLLKEVKLQLKDTNEDCCFFVSNEILEFLNKSSDTYSNFDPSIILIGWIIKRNLEMKIEANNESLKKICSIKTKGLEYAYQADSTTKKVCFYCE